MRFILFGRYRPEQHASAKQVFEQNGRSKRDFKVASREDYWALLVADNDQIVAECTLSIQHGLFSTRVQAYYISDVYVPEAHRGRQYAVALILNVMYELTTKSPEPFPPFYLHAYRHNRSALRCYRKIFGEPIRVGRRLVTFSSHPPRLWMDTFLGR